MPEQVSGLDGAAMPDLGSLLFRFQALALIQGMQIQRLVEELVVKDNLLRTVGLLPAVMPDQEGILGILAAVEEQEQEQEQQGGDGEEAGEEQQPFPLGPPQGFAWCKVDCLNAADCFVPCEGAYKVGMTAQCSPIVQSPSLFIVCGSERSNANAHSSFNIPSSPGKHGPDGHRPHRRLPLWGQPD